MLDSNEVLTTMAGSFGYAAPEVMLKLGHGKAVDMWSLGVITYTLLCGYSPFRSESLAELIEECRSGRVIFHERYWKEVSKDAKLFIGSLLQPDPAHRPTSTVSPRYQLSDTCLHTNSYQDALKHSWLKGETATDYDVLPEIKAYIAKARLKRGIEMIKLKNRIESLKMQEDEDNQDMPQDSTQAAAQGVTAAGAAPATPPAEGTRRISRAARSAIFREVVFAKVRDMKEQEAREKAERTVTSSATSSQKGKQGPSFWFSSLFHSYVLLQSYFCRFILVGQSDG